MRRYVEIVAGRADAWAVGVSAVRALPCPLISLKWF